METTPEQASQVAKEAKAIHHDLKEALKSRDPLDREIEFKRKNLRRLYLRLLLIHPYAKESEGAETNLWMQTSHQFISNYKQRLVDIDCALQTLQRPNQPRQGNHGPVEYRKLMQRFRQFLSEEEKFWTQLLGRFRRSYALHEAQHALITLGILPAAGDGESTLPDLSDPTQPAKEAPNHNNTGRSQFQFPPENGPSVVPRTSAAREGRLVIVSKALVCLGDIARYKELYNESNGRPKAGLEDNQVLRKNVRGKRGEQMVQRVRRYDRAKACYEQARLLVPNEGNPWHQLAILSSYQKDTFSSVVNYYRAICVLQPYDTASNNLITILTKALDEWKKKMKREHQNRSGPAAENKALTPPVIRLRVESFKEKVVLMHSLWRLSTEEMDNLSPDHAADVTKEFIFLVTNRHLPNDTVSDAIVLTQGALWKNKKFRDSAADPTVVKDRILVHLLDLHKALLDIGTGQINVISPEEAPDNNLAQRLTAAFKRTLPALRIAGKWLRANYKYVMQSKVENLFSLWESYGHFATALGRVFRLGQLPKLSFPLREDLDMRGFSPLKNLMGELEVGEGGDRSTSALLAAQNQVHPNEEELMRIWDLLTDVKILADLEDSPLVLQNGSYVLQNGQAARAVSRDVEIADDVMTETTDPVDDAFRHPPLDPSDEELEDDEDEIVWDPRASTSPPAGGIASPPATLSPPGRPIPITPARNVVIQPHPGSTTPTRTRGFSGSATSPTPVRHAPSTSITTAGDLLKKMTLGGSGLTEPPRQVQGSVPQPSILFGSDSIWSMDLNDKSWNLQSSLPANQQQAQPAFYRSPTHQNALALAQEHSTWSPLPYATEAGSYSSLINGLPSPAYANASRQFGIPAGISAGHQRVSSSPMAIPSLPSQTLQYHDTIGYSPPSRRSAGQGFALYSDPSVSSPFASSGMTYGHGGSFRNNSLSHNDIRGTGLPTPLSQLWTTTTG